jgi:serine/threonine protein kinase
MSFLVSGQVSIHPRNGVFCRTTGDPYVSLDRLGQGANGFVDKVEKRTSPGRVYARKAVRMTGHRRELSLRTVNNEARILRGLNHSHIVSVVGVYAHRNELSIIMLQVADANLEVYMQHVDSMLEVEDRDALRGPMKVWAGCLIQAIDYLHEKMVKHKDLKPANILVKGATIIFADFSISKEMIDEETTATSNEGPRGTPMYLYMALEANSVDEKRGRSVDVFSSGCILLEMAIVFVAPIGWLQRLYDFREIAGSQPYSRCPTKLVRWTWLLRRQSGQHFEWKSRGDKHDSLIYHNVELAGVSFLILDPNPNIKITSSQLVTLIHTQGPRLRKAIIELACDKCRSAPFTNHRNQPLHSVFNIDAYDNTRNLGPKSK